MAYSNARQMTNSNRMYAGGGQGAARTAAYSGGGQGGARAAAYTGAGRSAAYTAASASGSRSAGRTAAASGGGRSVSRTAALPGGSRISSRGVSRAQTPQGSRRTQSRSSRSSNRGPAGGSGGNGGWLLLLLLIIVVAALVAALFLVKGRKKTEMNPGTAQESQMPSTQALDTSVIQKDLYVDYSSIGGTSLLNIKGMRAEELSQKLRSAYSWKLTVKNGNPNLDSFKLPELPDVSDAQAAEGSGPDSEGSVQEVKVDDPLAKVSIRPTKDSFELPDLIGGDIDSFVEQLFKDYAQNAGAMLAADTQSTEAAESSASGDSSAADAAVQSSQAVKADYTLSLPDYSERLADYSAQLAAIWNVKAKNGEITSYDAAKDKFVFGGAVKGFALNKDALTAQLKKAIASGKFDASVTAEGEVTSASAESATDKYKIIGSFTTKTTANEVRNKNVLLSCDAINGFVLQPGEEFSFNKVVGERTAAKGYGAAAAYNNGEVVQEIGGGVCQTSTTLFNAVFRSGLTTTLRRSHTFEPSYVTPGLDATVSWGGPDYRFVNSSNHAIGIRASYSDRTCTVSIYGIPVLDEGVSWDLAATKLKDTPVPPTSVIASGKESSGSSGSEWVVYKVVKKNGKEVDKVKDHTAVYKGHTPTVLKSTLESQSQSAAESQAAASTEAAQSSAAAVPEGPGAAHSGSSGSNGPGSDSKPAEGAAAPKPTEAPAVIAPEGVGQDDAQPIPAGPGV